MWVNFGLRAVGVAHLTGQAIGPKNSNNRAVRH